MVNQLTQQIGFDLSLQIIELFDVRELFVDDL